MDLTDLVRRGWGFEIVRLGGLRLGHDADACTFRADLEDGGTLFLKVRKSLASGIATVARFRFGFVPSPLPTAEGAPAYWTGERWIVATPFVEGTNGFQTPLGIAQWRAFGAALRQVHDLPPEVGQFLMPERFDPEGWEELRDLVEITCRLAADGSGKPGVVVERLLSTGKAQDVLALAEKNLPTLLRLLSRTQSLADTCWRRDWLFVLCHADAHVGNVLVDREGGIHLIDWDEPRLAPRERDLMFIVGGGIAGWHGAAEEAAFFEGYGPCALDPLLLAYYRHAWAVSDLASWSREALQPAEEDPTQGAEALRFFRGLFDEAGIVRSALRSPVD